VGVGCGCELGGVSGGEWVLLVCVFGESNLTHVFLHIYSSIDAINNNNWPLPETIHQPVPKSCTEE